VGTVHSGWFRTVLVAWLPVAVVASALAGTSYAMAQQVTRSTVDDAPRALAQRAADTLSRGGTPAEVTPGTTVDLTTDLGPFLIVYGPDDAVRTSTATLEGTTPRLPPGVLAQARARGIDRVTWQPQAGVREAVIALPWRSTTAHGAVVAGASLRPSEDRQDQLCCFWWPAGWSRCSAPWR
jgi:hypothetical protein